MNKLIIATSLQKNVIKKPSTPSDEKNNTGKYSVLTFLVEKFDTVGILSYSICLYH